MHAPEAPSGGVRPDVGLVRSLRLALPSSRGLLGHVRYSAAAVRLLLDRRRRLRALDDDLGRAARERDRLLGALGEAARVGEVPDERVVAFSGTAAVLEGEQAAVERACESSRQVLDRTRAELRQALRTLGSQLAEAQERLAPAAGERIRLAGRHEDVARQREALRLELKAARIVPAATLQPDDTPSPSTARRPAPELEAQDEALDVLEQRLADLEAEIAHHRARVEALRRSFDETRRAGEADIAALEAAVRRDAARAEALRSRRQATLVDLGRALVEESAPPSGLEHAWQAARTGLERYELCRSMREALWVEGGAVDRRPLRRTLLTAALVTAAALLLWTLLAP